MTILPMQFVTAASNHAVPFCSRHRHPCVTFSLPHQLCGDSMPSSLRGSSIIMCSTRSVASHVPRWPRESSKQQHLRHHGVCGVATKSCVCVCCSAFLLLMNTSRGKNVDGGKTRMCVHFHFHRFGVMIFHSGPPKSGSLKNELNTHISRLDLV